MSDNKNIYVYTSANWTESLFFFPSISQADVINSDGFYGEIHGA